MSERHFKKRLSRVIFLRQVQNIKIGTANGEIGTADLRFACQIKRPYRRPVVASWTSFGCAHCGQLPRGSNSVVAQIFVLDMHILAFFFGLSHQVKLHVSIARRVQGDIRPTKLAALRGCTGSKIWGRTVAPRPPHLTGIRSLLP